MRIYAINDGFVLPYIVDPNFEKYLPVIPSEVSSVNFTWRSGEKNYYYNFNRLYSFNDNILDNPVISISQQGQVPKSSKVFQVFIPCMGNITGVAAFILELRITNMDTNRVLPGTPISLKLQKQCTMRGPDPECDKKCGNGKCNRDKICVCPTGELGWFPFRFVNIRFFVQVILASTASLLSVILSA